jgi:hypothetical protein
MTNELTIQTEVADSVDNAVLIPAKRKKSASKKTHAPRAPRTSVAACERGVVDQVKIAFAKQNLFATLCGFVLGGFVPVATFVVGHLVAPANNWFYILVFGGLLFSAKTVFDWGAIAFKSKFKSVGFVILIEGTMTFVPILGLAIAALALLTTINGVATAVRLVTDSKEGRRQ